MCFFYFKPHKHIALHQIHKILLFLATSYDPFKITYNRTAMHFMDDCFVNQGEEGILTLLWQSGASESATVCFVISFKYLLLTAQMQSFMRRVCVCVCV